jgi:hypothetical protein
MERWSKGHHEVGEVRDGNPWGTFYRLREAVEGTGDVGSLAAGSGD